MLTSTTIRGANAGGIPLHQPFVVDREEGTNLVRVRGYREWTVTDIDAHFDHLECVLAQVREVHRSTRVLVDVREGISPSPEVLRRIGERASQVYAAEDRVALLVSSSVVKVQTRQIHGGRNQEIFVSECAAEIWLSAWH